MGYQTYKSHECSSRPRRQGSAGCCHSLAPVIQWGITHFITYPYGTLGLIYLTPLVFLSPLVVRFPSRTCVPPYFPSFVTWDKGKLDVRVYIQHSSPAFEAFHPQICSENLSIMYLGCSLDIMVGDAACDFNI